MNRYDERENYIIKEVNCDNADFKELCVKLDDFQNNMIMERASLGFTALAGLERLQKILVMYDNEKAIACASLKPVNKTTCEIARIYTEEEYRGKGLAKLLTNRIIELANDLGYNKMILDTWKDGISARALYQKMGFIEIPMFDIDTLKKSFSMDDEDKLKKIQELLVFMERDI
ncbi:MAG: GNAT family N-acetyltransferase [Oscillospiraceae bacterium]|nr:GNAT family N-acetyltransferase [Oscillospiraceae bacterium]